MQCVANLCLACEGHVQGEEVALAKSLIEGDQAHSNGGSLSLRCKRVMCNDGHAETPGSPCNLAAHLCQHASEAQQPAVK